MKKRIHSGLAIFIILLIAVVLGGYIYWTASNLSYPVATLTTYVPPSNATSTEDDNNYGIYIQDEASSSVANPFMASLYAGTNYQKGGAVDCLIQSTQASSTFSILNCPDLAGTIQVDNTDKATSTVEDLGQLIRIDAITENPVPVETYLYKNRNASSTMQYQTLYANDIVSKYLQNESSDTVVQARENISVEHSADDLYLQSPFPVEIDPVNSNLDTVILSDIYDSGAYNIYDTIFTVDYSAGTFKVRMPAVIEEQDGKLAAGKSDGPDLVNSEFDPATRSLNAEGFLPFGIYPCNEAANFIVKADRLILDSKTQLKACNGIDIESPEDIPDDFDDQTTVTTYQMSPSLLNSAMTISPSTLPVLKVTDPSQG